jgi:phage terminase large subunit
VEINEAYVPFFESQHRYAVLMGGAGSAKSVSAHQKTILRITTEENHRFLAIRKVKNTLRSSVYQLFYDLILKYDLEKEFHINKTEMRFLHLLTGNEIICVGLDDPEKIKSIAGITSVLVEEATELEEKDFNQLELRVRGETTNYKQFTICFNPIDEQHWLKKRFFDTEDDQVFKLKTTYRDNAFLDEDYVKHLTQRVISNENLYKVYVLGEWGRISIGGEFYKKFKFSKQVKSIVYNPDLALHISFDFNVNPYMTCTIWQMSNKILYQIGEICAKSPNNTTKGVCREFERRYYSHDSGLFIYGDPSGKQEDTRSEKGYNDFRIIEKELERFKPVFRVASKAPPVVMRGNFINTIFEANFEGIEIYIDEKCNNTINDYVYLKEASDGTKLKEKAKDPDTGVQYEKFGHCSDANDYLICEAFSAEFSIYQRGTRKLEYTIGRREHNIRNIY